MSSPEQDWSPRTELGPDSMDSIERWLGESPKDGPWNPCTQLHRDIIVAPARKPLPMGEQKTWDSKTGRVTTQPSRRKSQSCQTSAANTTDAQASPSPPDGRQILTAPPGVDQDRKNERQSLPGSSIGGAYIDPRAMESAQAAGVTSRDAVTIVRPFPTTVPLEEPTGPPAQQATGGPHVDPNVEEWLRNCTTLYEDGEEDRERAE
ncbi:hypothetical protein QBC43DRAFT_294030 [Cladorrhinum sp. PSN259]|nr:hypothetical protein QBC43DRAFT_294030 [Cladorrhinum sp. PSN259]